MHGHTVGAVAAFSSLVELLSLRATERGDKSLYRFLEEDGSEACWTYGDLERAAQRIAAGLEEQVVEREPVILLYPPGLEFIAAFFGCLYAGAIPLPAYLPRLGRSMRRLETIIADSKARVALTIAPASDPLRPAIETSESLRSLVWLTTPDLPEEPNYQPHAATADTIAFLQYTSGSTGNPKGVVVTHGSLMHNLASVSAAFDLRPGCSGVNWLPMYHDMGLIGGILAALYGGGLSVLFSPIRFLQRPLNWLEAISKFKATHSGAPNFAYDLCVDRTTPEERAKLDLTHWQVAFCGAETIRNKTLARFAEAFEPAGFRAESFRTCYGLAESTLMVTARTAGDPLLELSIQQRPLEEGRIVVAPAPNDNAITLIGSGAVVGNQRVHIVDPQTRLLCPPGHIGEVWIQGPSVAQGYWQHSDLTAEMFSATLAETDEGPFLRSGDLGFFHQGQLFVTGRIKELMIIRGRKHFPQDIEFTAQSSHSALQPNGGAAFAVDRGGREEIVLLHEVRRESLRSFDAASVVSAICQAVTQEYEVRLDVVGLLRPGSISRTTSGKIERHACRNRFLDEDFQFIELWKSPTAGYLPRAKFNGHCAIPVVATSTSVISLVEWISNWLARRLNLPASEIDPNKHLAQYGLDSLMAVELIHEVELTFGCELDIGALVDATSIQALAQRLAQEAEPGSAIWAPDTSDVLLPGVAKPTYRGPFGDRADGILVRGESAVRQMIPYLMRGRNESVAYHEVLYDISRTTAWLDQYNRQHPERRATLFDLFLWAAAYVAHTRPGINRFISGRRIYQRREVAISFAAKKRFDAAAPMITIKLRFPHKIEPFPACLERIAHGLEEACHGPPRAVDRETQFALRLPRFLLRTALWGYRVLDHCNLLPGKVIENDPLYASLFVANLGSLGLDRTFHHLYEHGTCSLFAALGLPKRIVACGTDGRPEPRHVWPVYWTLDERIADGFYSAGCMRLLKSILENPGEFVPSTTPGESRDASDL